jgi:CRP-like cAMP-binding protein
VKSFLFPGEFIGSLAAAYAGDPCSFSLVSLQKSEAMAIPFESLYEAATDDLELSGELNNFLIELAMKKERREYEFLCLPAKARYRALLERQPDIYESITQNDVARYLGITPVALSRIKQSMVSTS